MFIDTDILLDVALARKPFLNSSKLVLSLTESCIAIGFTSSNVTANIYYILRKAGGDSAARYFISQLVKFVRVISIDHSDIIAALESPMSDFEDALQAYSAFRHQCDCLVTRNITDYKNAPLQAYTPEEFLNLFAEIL